MIGRIVFLTVVLAGTGVVSNFVRTPRPAPITELQMRSLLPTKVAGMDYLPGPEKGESYHMDADTYDKLDPAGIVARVFQGGEEKYDTVVIAGDNPNNFHDPTWCLPGQGWELGSRQETSIETKAHGTVPVSYFEAKNGNQKMLVMYTYRGPLSFHSGINKLGMDFLTSDFLQKKDRLGVFYRFLSMGESTSVEATKRFAVDYLDSANKISKGIF